jgi:uncharacterized Zn finger protein (UPF0148 family)
MSWWIGCCDGADLSEQDGALVCSGCGHVLPVESGSSPPPAAPKRVTVSFEARRRAAEAQAADAALRGMIDRLRREEEEATLRHAQRREAAKEQRRSAQANADAEDRGRAFGAEIRRRVEHAQQASASPPTPPAPPPSTSQAPPRRRARSQRSLSKEKKMQFDHMLGRVQSNAASWAGSPTRDGSGEGQGQNRPLGRVAVDLLARHVLSFQSTPHLCLGLSAAKPSRIALRKRYLHLSLRLHPDKTTHPLARDAFVVVQRAFRALLLTVR